MTANTTASRKNKGRALQHLVVEQVLRAFPVLTPDDVRSAPMGTRGSDVVLSAIGKKLFPYDVECKNVENLNFWKAFEQADWRCQEDRQPLLVAKRNRKRPIVVMDLEHFFELVYAKANESK